MADHKNTYQYTFTVFTPSYNRAHTLHRVYESLATQTFRDFEWLIVDDGSTDATRALVEGWQGTADFPVRYLYQENQGKHIAFNRGVAEARGFCFFCLDSDDACVPETLERLCQHWEAISDQDKPRFAGVTMLSVNQHGVLWGNTFPEAVIDSDTVEMYYRFGARGDKKHMYKTDVLKQFPFPAPDGVAFIPETIVWRTIGRTYKTRFINEPLYVRYTSEDDVPDQLSKTVSVASYAYGGRLLSMSNLNNDLRWLWYAPAEFVRSAVNYSRFSFHTRTTLPEQAQHLRNPWVKLLWIVSMPVGILSYIRDRRKRQH